MIRNSRKIQYFVERKYNYKVCIMYPKASVTKFHKLGNLEQQKFI